MPQAVASRRLQFNRRSDVRALSRKRTPEQRLADQAESSAGVVGTFRRDMQEGFAVLK